MNRKIFRAALISLFCLLSLSVLGVMQAQTYAVITANNVGDGGGNLLASGKLCFTPGDANGNPLAIRAASGGQIVNRPQCVPVSSGVITPASGTFQLLNTQTSFPSPFCWSATLQTNSGTFPSTGYNCIQMSSSWCSTVGSTYTCNLDNYPPASTAQAPVAAPSLTGGTFTTGAAGSSVSCTVSVAGLVPNYALSCAIPQGTTGPTGPAGPAGPAGSASFTASAIQFAPTISSTRAATYSDIIALFTGCTGTQYPGADGNCHTASAAPSGGVYNVVGYSATNTAASIDPTQGSYPVPPSNATTVPQPSVSLPKTGWTGGSKHFGDSITNGTGATGCTSTGNCYAALIAQAAGTASNYNNYGVVGAQACDTVKTIFNNDSPTSTDLILRTYKTSLNDADGQLPWGYLENFNLCNLAALTWEGIYSTNKLLGSAVTPATNWATDTTYSSAMGLTTSTFNAAQVWPVSFTSNGSWPTYFSPHLFVWYRFGDVGGSGLAAPGVFTITGLGNTVTINTATGAPMLTALGVTDAIGVVDLGTIGGTTRTVNMTTTMLSATGTVSILGFGYNDALVTAASGAASPTVWVGGTSRLLGPAYSNEQSTATYDYQQQANVAYLNGLGFNNVYMVKDRNCWINTPANMSTDGKHPNPTGHQQLANCFLAPTAVPNTNPLINASVHSLRTISSATNCQLSSTDDVVMFSAGTSSFSCVLPAPSGFYGQLQGMSKQITLEQIGTGVVTLTSPLSSQVSGSAVGFTLQKNQGVTIGKNYQVGAIVWNVVGSPTFSAAVENVCKVQTLPYTVLDADSDSCIVSASAGGVFTLPATNTASRSHTFVNVGTAAMTFTGAAGNCNSYTLFPGNTVQCIARSTGTTFDIASGTKIGGYRPISATTGGAYTLLAADELLYITAAAGATITLPTTFVAGKSVDIVNASVANITFTGATSGNANTLVIIPGQQGRITAGSAAGAWYGGLLPTQSVFTGTSVTLGTTAIGAGACSAVVTATVTGAASTMVAELTPTVDITTVAGYGTGGLTLLDIWITANTVNIKVCNPTAASITPGALTVNVRVIQ